MQFIYYLCPEILCNCAALARHRMWHKKPEQEKGGVAGQQRFNMRLWSYFSFSQLSAVRKSSAGTKCFKSEEQLIGYLRRCDFNLRFPGVFRSYKKRTECQYSQEKLSINIFIFINITLLLTLSIQETIESILQSFSKISSYIRTPLLITHIMYDKWFG